MTVVFQCKNTLATFLFLITTLLMSGLCHAQLNIKLEEPTWNFLLQNQPLAATAAQPEINERVFVAKIKPLLAQKQYHAVMDAFANRPIDADSAALRLLRGQILLQLKQFSAAEKSLISALDIMPDLALAHRSLSLVYIMQKRYDEAQPQLRRTIELGVGDAQVYGQLAYINLQTKDPAAAVAGYQQALFLEPDNPQWRQGLLYALTKSQALDQAQALLENLIKENSSNPQLWLHRSQIAMQRQQHNQALSSLEVAIHLGENNPANLTTTAQLHLQYGSARRAIDLLGQSIDQNPQPLDTDMLDTVEQALSWLVYQKDWRNAHRLMERMAKVKDRTPKDYNARINVVRAQLALQKNQLDRAEQYLLQTLTNIPNHGEALLSLGQIYQQRQQPERALLYYVRAEALSEVKERALLQRAQLEIDRKNYGESLRLLREVAQQYPHRGDVISNIQVLENLVRNQG